MKEGTGWEEWSTSKKSYVCNMVSPSPSRLGKRLGNISSSKEEVSLRIGEKKEVRGVS